MTPVPSFEDLSDADLTKELARLLRAERGATAHLVACIGEFDLRRLYLPQGFSSMFTYCRDHLHLGDGAAYRRIEAARAARRFPEILVLIADGAVTLTNVVLVAQHLTTVNHNDVMTEITHKKKGEVEIIVARLKPRPDASTLIRKMASPPGARAGSLTLGARIEPQSDDHAIPATSSFRPVVVPLAPERFKLQITMNQETHDRLRQLQNLMRHSIPSGDAALIVERALKLLLEEVLRRKCGALKRPRNGREGTNNAEAAPGLLH